MGGIPGFPTAFQWIDTDAPTSAYSIRYEAVLAQIFQIHPDWLEMLHAIDGRTLMTEARWRAILADHHPWRRRLGARWR